LHRLLAQPGARDSLAHLKPGSVLGFDLPVDGQLRTLRFDRDPTHRVELSLRGDEVREQVIERPTEVRTVVISGEVGRSLYRSARKLGLSAKNINTLTDDIFKYDIDFNDDVGASDRFSVVVDQMWRDGELWPDFVASSQRVVIGYSISLLIGVSLGLLIGSFASINAFFEPQVGFLRYIPATALVPLLIIWLGIDEAPKIALVVVGTVFYNILMVADVARAVPNELIKASYTLGARRWTVMRRVIFPHSWPGIVDVARINLAAAWLMLVVAELLAAQEGLAFRIIRAQRFRRIDRMFALLLVFGILGIVSDMALRMLRNRTARWARDD